MVVGLNDYLDAPDKQQQGRNPNIHRTPPLPQQVSNNYYEEEDNVAYSTANQLLKDDNLSIGGRSIWNDRGIHSLDTTRY